MRRTRAGRAGLAGLLLICGTLAGAEAPRYLPRTWRTDDGLPVNVVVAIAQTGDGYLWMGTEEGLVRFDGTRFTVFDRDSEPVLGESCVRGLSAGRDGGLWVVTCSGSLFRRKGDAFSRVGAAGFLGKGPICPVLEDAQGVLWIGTEGRGVARVGKGSTTFLGTESGLPNGAVQDLCEAGPGKLWVATRGGLALLDGGRFATVLTSREGLVDTNVLSLAREPGGALWIGTAHGGLHRWEGGALRTVESPGPNVTALGVDPKGRVFVGTSGAGVRLVEGPRTIVPSGLESLSPALVQRLLFDSEGALWTATAGMGITRATRRRVTMQTTAEGLSGDIVLPVFESRSKDLWAGTAGAGLNLLRDGRWTRFGKKEGLSSELVFALGEDAEGRLLVGTSAGLERLENGRFSPYTAAGVPVRPAVSRILLARDGGLVAGTHTGGLIFVSGGVLARVTAKDGLSSDRVLGLLEARDGRLLVGTAAGGLDVVKGGKVVSRGADGPLDGFQVQCLHGDPDGVLWAGTANKGLVRLEGGKRAVFGRAEGLLDETVFALVEDGSGKLWMTSNRGIFAATLREFEAVARGEKRTVQGEAFGRPDGMASKECNGGVHPAGIRRADGTLWFPTMAGIAVVDPTVAGQVRSLPATLLERVEVDGVPIPLDGSTAVLPAGTRRLDATFTAPDLTEPESLRFRVRLEPFESDWVPVGSRRAVTYTNLEPGRYTLSVSAVRGSATGNAATLTLRVKPRFYRTLPFYLLCAVLAAVAFEGIVRLRQRRAREKDRLELAERRRTEDAVRALNEQLEQRVARRTADLEAANREMESFAYTVSHDLRAPLRAIDAWSVLLQEECSDPLGEEGREYLSRIRAGAKRMAELIGGILELSRLSRGDLRRESIDLGAMASAIVDDLRARDPGRDVELSVAPELRADGDPILVHALLENLLGNAWKFSARCGKARIEVGREDEAGATVFFVRDDGAGFDMAHAGRLFDPFQRLHGDHEFPGLGVGLATVQRIVRRHGGRVWAEGEPGRGATFRFTLAPES